MCIKMRFNFALLALVFSCAHRSRDVAPPPGASRPIVAENAAALGSAKAECDALLVELQLYGKCATLDDDGRADAVAQADQAAIDFAPASSSKIDAKSQTDIAVSCHKAVAATRAANAKCAGKAAPPLHGLNVPDVRCMDNPLAKGC
jgi:hypothetical protein